MLYTYPWPEGIRCPNHPDAERSLMMEVTVPFVNKVGRLHMCWECAEELEAGKAQSIFSVVVPAEEHLLDTILMNSTYIVTEEELI